MTCILVVCTGNICRSPIAHGILRDELQRRLGDEAPEVVSAGISGWDGSPATPEAVEAANERGSDISGHVARRLVRRDIDRANLILCMSAEHREEVLHAVPRASEKTFTLKELVRLLETRPAEAAGDLSWTERVRAASELRRSGFPGNPNDEDIADPLGLPFESYRAVAWEIDEWISRLVESLLGKAPARAGIWGEEP
jgi:low molecular weight protein-tyrosine phosphatase